MPFRSDVLDAGSPMEKQMQPIRRTEAAPLHAEGGTG